MYLKKLKIENFRLLKDVSLEFEPDFTIFVGKNNSGKTSILSFIKLLLTKGSYPDFYDYPLGCRKGLIHSFLGYMRNEISEENCLKSISIMRGLLEVDYSRMGSNEHLGGLSEWIIDLDEGVSIAKIEVSYELNIDQGWLVEFKDEFNLLSKQLINEGGNQSSGVFKPPELLEKILQKRWGEIFEKRIRAINPSDPLDTLIKTGDDLEKTFLFKTIHAERALDESGNKTSSSFGNLLEGILKDNLNSDLDEAAEELRTMIERLDYATSPEIETLMDRILSSMLQFGYPPHGELTPKVISSLDLSSHIHQNTDIAYVTNEDSLGPRLPSTHNGLGFKNLIKLTLEFQLLRKEVEELELTRIPILFLEEPEAHMHPQMQQVFISHVEQVLKKQKVQTLLTTHSSHIANAAPFESIRYMIKDRKKYASSCKNLKFFITNTETSKESTTDNTSKEKAKENLDFIKKYLGINNCDLFFCDKAILVEGASERLLLPDIIKRTYKGKETKSNEAIPLSSQYISIIEVGGMHAYKFFNFLNYLEIPTLVISDIDFIDEGKHKCEREAAKSTSNATIMRWHKDAFKENEHLTGGEFFDWLANIKNRRRGNLFLAVQEEEESYHPRSLEEAIINVNRSLYKVCASDEISDKAKGFKKTDFALNLVMKGEYSSPSYILEGLEWLNNFEVNSE